MDDAQIEELRDHTERLQGALDRLQREKPGLPTITYIVMANDVVSAERADELLRQGKLGWKDAVWACGSYTRMDYALRWADEGLVPRQWLLTELPSLWSGSDPDDTDPRFLELWREAWVLNDRQTVTDGPPLPHRGRARVRVFRGQMERDDYGIAWSLDEAVARKFAGGASYRTRVPGVVFEGVIPANLVMGYMTGRNEAEVILCPADLLT